jgi:hypothetical protein
MGRMRRWRLGGDFARGGTALAALLLSLTGCEHGDYAEDRLTVRREHIDNVAKSVERREASNDRRLGEAWDWFDTTLRRDARETNANGARIEARWNREVEHFEREQPNYQKTAGRIFRGKPETIERAAISMFY